VSEKTDLKTMLRGEAGRNGVARSGMCQQSDSKWAVFQQGGGGDGSESGGNAKVRGGKIRFAGGTACLKLLVAKADSHCKL